MFSVDLNWTQINYKYMLFKDDRQNALQYPSDNI